jgi:Ca-activated chloride channel family protein
MLGLHVLHPERVHWMWAALAVVAILAVLELYAKDRFATFLSPVMQRRLASRASTSRTVVKLALFLLALWSGVAALMRPQAEGQSQLLTTSRASADVMFVLDVSRSMLAEDAAPNRLARAKVEIAQLVTRLKDHRVGLVAFAGRAVPLCPLTEDKSFFNLVLSGVDTSSVGKGGTRIGEAVRTALRSFPPGQGAKLIVLITDGEDHESFPLDAAEAAKAEGVHIIAVGLGSEEGSEIVLTDPRTGARTVQLHEGKPVITRLDGETLRKMTEATEGAYVPAGVSALDLDSIVAAHVTPIVRAGIAAAQRTVPVELFAWFILASLVLVLAALWVGASHRRST